MVNAFSPLSLSRLCGLASDAVESGDKKLTEFTFGRCRAEP